jgi:hypothetical protein
MAVIIGESKISIFKMFEILTRKTFKRSSQKTMISNDSLNISGGSNDYRNKGKKKRKILTGRTNKSILPVL